MKTAVTQVTGAPASNSLVGHSSVAAFDRVESSGGDVEGA